MPRESKKDMAARGAKILNALREEYGSVHTALRYEDPWELLVATILSAQCTDVRVNEVTPELFDTFPTIEAFAAAEREHIEQIIRPTGFFRNKARAIHESAQQIVDELDGEMPDTIEGLTQLRGVARKTASVVLQEIIKPEGPHDGVVVDTHVQRLSKRMGLVPSTWDNADKIEKRMMDIFPSEDWNLAFVFIEHGRAVCTARKARCGECVVDQFCPKRGV